MELSKYENKCKNNFPLQYNKIQKLYDFLRDYDLIHCYDYSYDLFDFFIENFMTGNNKMMISKQLNHSKKILILTFMKVLITNDAY